MLLRQREGLVASGLERAAYPQGRPHISEAWRHVGCRAVEYPFNPGRGCGPAVMTRLARAPSGGCTSELPLPSRQAGPLQRPPRSPAACPPAPQIDGAGEPAQSWDGDADAALHPRTRGAQVGAAPPPASISPSTTSSASTLLPSHHHPPPPSSRDSWVAGLSREGNGFQVILEVGLGPGGG